MQRYNKKQHTSNSSVLFYCLSNYTTYQHNGLYHSFVFQCQFCILALNLQSCNHSDAMMPIRITKDIKQRGEVNKITKEALSI